jgi:hypothetical protein
MAEEWSRAITISRADSQAHMHLLPYGALFDQRRYPRNYSVPFLFVSFSTNSYVTAEMKQRNQNVFLLNTIIAVYQLFVETWSPACRLNAEKNR